MLLNILVTELFSGVFSLGLRTPIAYDENFALDFTGSRRKAIMNVCWLVGFCYFLIKKAA